MMARILFYTSPGLGHLYPALGLAKELDARGHQVVIVGLSQQCRKIQERRFQAEAMDPRVEAEEMDDYLGSNPMQALKRAVATFGRRAPYEVLDLQQQIEKYQPDLLVIDTNSFGARAAAEASDLPWVCFQPFLSPLPARHLPPFGPGLAMDDSVWGRLRNLLLGALINRVLKSLTLDAANPVRTQLSLAPVEDILDFHTRPHRTLYFTSAEFDYPRDDWPDSYVMCGPVGFESASEPPAWLKQETRKIVLVTCSTEMQKDRVIIEMALEALRDTNYLVVATSAAHDPATFNIPANARVEKFLPHDPLLEHAAAVICHGGMGITQKALAKGVPVCVVPFGRDQLEVARRVEYAKAGAQLSPSKLTPAALSEAVEKTVECKPGARRVAVSYQNAGGSQRAADTVIELLTAELRR